MTASDQFHRLEQQVKQLREGTVLGAEIVGGHIEVEVRLAPSGKAIWTEMLEGLGGGGGGTIRVPTDGDSVLVAMIDGDHTAGFVLGWLADQSTPDPGEIEPGRTYFVAPDGEGIEIRAGEDGGTKVEVEPDGTVHVTGAPVVVDSDDIRLGGAQPGDDEALNAKLVEWVTNKLINAWAVPHTHLQVLPLLPMPPAPTAPTAPAVPPATVAQPGPKEFASDTVRSD